MCLYSLEISELKFVPWEQLSKCKSDQSIDMRYIVSGIFRFTENIYFASLQSVTNWNVCLLLTVFIISWQLNSLLFHKSLIISTQFMQAIIIKKKLLNLVRFIHDKILKRLNENECFNVFKQIFTGYSNNSLFTKKIKKLMSL